mmetsp:Transcript_5535/g.5680  ORF Transcript_5535/g.5680 Transcript_5535/m.5680 type:complete len:142 (+) Transcript_5535:13-438(+)
MYSISISLSMEKPVKVSSRLMNMNFMNKSSNKEINVKGILKHTKNTEITGNIETESDLIKSITSNSNWAVSGDEWKIQEYIDDKVLGSQDTYLNKPKPLLAQMYKNCKKTLSRKPVTSTASNKQSDDIDVKKYLKSRMSKK